MMRTNNFTIDDVEYFEKYFSELVYDAKATRSVHFQCSSFYWSDEMPSFIDDGYDASIRHFMLYLLSYRKVLMFGEEVSEFAPLWNHLKVLCPNWPGFRAERISASLIEQLEAEVNREFERFERMLDVCSRRKTSRK